jgi:hypothetical protein
MRVIPVRDAVGSVLCRHRGERLRPLLGRLPVRCVTNPDFDRGMYSSLVIGMRAFRPRVEVSSFPPTCRRFAATPWRSDWPSA